MISRLTILLASTAFLCQVIGSSRLPIPGGIREYEEKLDPDDLFNDYTVRLIDCDGGEALMAGRLEMFYKDYWGTVCGDTFTTEAARVACYSLGYRKASAIYLHNTYGPSKGLKVILGGLNCTGNETHLDRCSHPHYEEDGVAHCTNNMDVSIACDPVSDDIIGYQTRLVPCPAAPNQINNCPVDPPNRSTAAGRIEILYNGTWGTVCNYHFSPISARVFCRQLFKDNVEFGFPVNGTFIDNVRYPAADSLRLWLGFVQCIGDELNIGSCPHVAWGKHACNHNDDVVVQCFGLR
jgi:hypothetical protein